MGFAGWRKTPHPNTKLNGLEILEYRPVATTTTQTAFVAPPLRINGAVFVEASTSVRTMIAIANTSGEDASVDLTFTDTAGTASAPVTVTVPAGGQTFKFVADPPISIGECSAGALQFNSSIPVSVIALSFFTIKATTPCHRDPGRRYQQSRHCAAGYSGFVRWTWFEQRYLSSSIHR